MYEEILHSAEGTIVQLEQARTALSEWEADYEAAKWDLAVTKAKAWQQAVDHAGGEKMLGSDAGSRELAFTRYLSNHAEYCAFRELARKAEEARDHAVIQVKVWEDQLSIQRAFLYAQAHIN